MPKILIDSPLIPESIYMFPFNEAKSAASDLEAWMDRLIRWSVYAFSSSDPADRMRKHGMAYLYFTPFVGDDKKWI
jgi:hypothetical protein